MKNFLQKIVTIDPFMEISEFHKVITYSTYEALVTDSKPSYSYFNEYKALNSIRLFKLSSAISSDQFFIDVK